MWNQLHINPTGRAAPTAAAAAAAPAAAATTGGTNQNSTLHNQVISSAAAATAPHHPCSQNVMLYGTACALRRHLPALLRHRGVVPQCIGAGGGEGEGGGGEGEGGGGEVEGGGKEGEGGGDHELARGRAAMVADAEVHFVDDEEEDMWGQVKSCGCK